MKIAKASERDINMAIELCGLLESLEKGFMPVSNEDNKDAEFDRDNPDDCRVALNIILDKLRAGCIARVVWGMAWLAHPESKLLDLDADIIKAHPSLSNRQQRQAEILQWANTTFGESAASNTGERTRRFAEEAIEAIQAVGLDKKSLHDIIDHVYGKPAGDIAQEIGQVGLSLLGLAEHLGIHAEEEERKEFQRVLSLPPEHWQARQNAKANKGLALPSAATEWGAC